MFDKFKQLGELNKMRQQANALQKELEKIIETIEKNGWSVSVTGDQKLRYIKHGEEDMKFLVDLINEAMKAALGGELTIPAEDADRKIFALLDTFLLDSISALRALTEMQAAGMNEQYMFAAVVNHTRLLLQLTGRSEFPADEKIHPFVLQKARAKVRNLEPAVISRAYKRLFKEDVKIKTGIVDPYNSLAGSILIA